ncbi:hypothetical protein Tco_0327340 [Tanacetum coccineum]
MPSIWWIARLCYRMFAFVALLFHVGWNFVTPTQIDCIMGNTPYGRTKIRDSFSLSFHAWYLDDGTIIGDTLVVEKVLELILEDGPRLGLHVNVDKTKIFWPKEDARSISKLYFAMRTCSLRVFELAQRSFDAALRSSLERIVTAFGPGFCDWQWRLSTLPFAFGGLGELDIPLLSVLKPCSACSRVFAGDIYGDHVVSCAGGKEVYIELGEGRDKPLRPTDMLLYSWDRGLDVCVDLTCSSPLTQTGMVNFMELEKDVVTLLKWIRKFSLTQDIGARTPVHIFNRISFAIARGVGAQIFGIRVSGKGEAILHAVNRLIGDQRECVGIVAFGHAFEDALRGYNVKMETNLLSVPLFSVLKPCSTRYKVFSGDIYGDHVVSCAGIIRIKHRHNVAVEVMFKCMGLWLCEVCFKMHTLRAKCRHGEGSDFVPPSDCGDGEVRFVLYDHTKPQVPSSLQLDHVDELVLDEHVGFTLPLLNILLSKGLCTVKSSLPVVSLLVLHLCLLKTFCPRSYFECGFGIKHQRQNESIANFIRSWGIPSGSLQLVREALAKPSLSWSNINEENLDFSERNVKQCKRKICDGHYTATLRVLSSFGVAPYNDATLEDLKAK